jgi:hypothetical protein
VSGGEGEDFLFGEKLNRIQIFLFFVPELHSLSIFPERATTRITVAATFGERSKLIFSEKFLNGNFMDFQNPGQTFDG